MPPSTKIGFLREEFERIGCGYNPDVLAPQIMLSWHFSDIVVSISTPLSNDPLGLREKRVRSIDYEILCELLKEIPNGVGEKKFWDIIDKADFQALADKVNEKLMRKLELEIKKSTQAKSKKSSKRISVKKRDRSAKNKKSK